MASEHRLFTEALDQFNTAEMQLEEVIRYLMKTYKISESKATKVAMAAEAVYSG